MTEMYYFEMILRQISEHTYYPMYNRCLIKLLYRETMIVNEHMKLTLSFFENYRPNPCNVTCPSYIEFLGRFCAASVMGYFVRAEHGSDCVFRIKTVY